MPLRTIYPPQRLRPLRPRRPQRPNRMNPKPINAVTARSVVKPRRSFSVSVRPSEEIRTALHKTHGATTGLGICSYAAVLLKMNEELPKTNKLTDEDIKVLLLREYPDGRSTKRLAEGKITVGYYRTRYNDGTLTGLVPVVKSRRYTARGELADRRTGRPLIGAQLMDAILEIEAEQKRLATTPQEEMGDVDISVSVR